MEIAQKVSGFLTRFFRKYELGRDEDIFSLGFVNSLFATQLIMFLEKEFDITVEPEEMDLNNFRTINAIVEFVERKKVAINN
ncbi:acyl carrier protein [Lysinibacillus sp. NPDC058147]|uniref:acyl carrier protein n=1 Tax=unclassified Lysinibacillus TaxID=2636778 RepID=UPI0036DC243C